MTSALPTRDSPPWTSPPRGSIPPPSSSDDYSAKTSAHFAHPAALVREPRQTKDGDWSCTVCNNVNFAKRTRCNVCQTARPPASEDSLEEVPHFAGPPGLFKRGDWPCAHCGNVNWARRDKCNMCNSPKPSGGEEPRTGRGGGHYDLQDPSDRTRHDSDEEDFDEFGRKKKRQGHSRSNQGDVHASSRDGSVLQDGSAQLFYTRNDYSNQSFPFAPPPPPMIHERRHARSACFGGRRGETRDEPEHGDVSDLSHTNSGCLKTFDDSFRGRHGDIGLPSKSVAYPRAPPSARSATSYQSHNLSRSSVHHSSGCRRRSRSRSASPQNAGRNRRDAITS